MMNRRSFIKRFGAVAALPALVGLPKFPLREPATRGIPMPLREPSSHGIPMPSVTTTNIDPVTVTDTYRYTTYRGNDCPLMINQWTYAALDPATWDDIFHA